MKITGDIYNVAKVYNKQKSVGNIAKAGQVVPKKDVVSISNDARDFQTVSKALKDVPDIRQNKVDEFADLYRSGGYDISGKEILEKIGKSVMDKKA
ncbi:negative regulator of flagellin synthesis FlgM [Ruminiclostridium sufflavum DSM 19573]|uniref:Negative regulator of flagellin synthesis FlgM n=1 Tax=Ruminiclostridium sufflavum DSM 19573 TaxID=1121337 RepID=A0A318Y183_9FIRM|nr:flagellar biosynthesis anti-sigma factor FlgM [Ruminiclostridium sufflavum]PYG89109.1 negative regulator of flagellin synthesis FlgM [Ruminiclostridium sufflavum DSM 19573]